MHVDQLGIVGGLFELLHIDAVWGYLRARAIHLALRGSQD